MIRVVEPCALKPLILIYDGNIIEYTYPRKQRPRCWEAEPTWHSRSLPSIQMSRRNCKAYIANTMNARTNVLMDMAVQTCQTRELEGNLDLG